MFSKREELQKKELIEIRNNLFRKIYESTASNPMQWLSNARSLQFAADLLKPSFEKELNSTHLPAKKNNFEITVGQIYLMIIGFATENYLKGIYVTQNPEIIENDKLIKLNSHTLLKLFQELNLKISKKEIDLIERLEEFILWAGRYPIPAKFQRLIPKPHRESTKLDFIVYSLSTDIKVATKLLKRLDKMLTEIIHTVA
jgi:hypothetical protein